MVQCIEEKFFSQKKFELKDNCNSKLLKNYPNAFYFHIVGQILVCNNTDLELRHEMFVAQSVSIVYEVSHNRLTHSQSISFPFITNLNVSLLDYSLSVFSII